MQYGSEEILLTINCNAGKTIAGISPQGDIYPCIILRHKVGSVRDRSLQDIWHDNPDPFLTELSSMQPEDVSKCYTCKIRSFYWRLTGRQNLDFFASLYGWSGRAKITRISEVLSSLGLKEEADKPFRLYSAGMKQKLLLARAMLSRPEILLLDEPTVHLDPTAKRSFHRLIREHLIGMVQATVLLCTHDLAEAEELANHMILLNEGRVLAEGSLSTLRGMVRPKLRFIMEFSRLPRQGWAEGLPLVLELQDNGRLVIRVQDESAISKIVSASISGGGRIRNFRIHEESLADVFTRLTSEEGS